MGRIIDPYANAEAVRRPSGAVIIDGQHCADTVQCCHCGAHFAMIRGSGTKRGFCTKCMGVTCGERKCDPCVPAEKRLDLWEKQGR
jgi:hypothetical protein